MDQIGKQELDPLMGGATDFKVRVQNRIRERSERKKNFVSPLFQMWGVQASKYQQGPIEYIEICCLVVTLINIGRPRPMVL